jgi:hypothetical protein
MFMLAFVRKMDAEGAADGSTKGAARVPGAHTSWGAVALIAAFTFSRSACLRCLS